MLCREWRAKRSEFISDFGLQFPKFAHLGLQIVEPKLLPIGWQWNSNCAERLNAQCPVAPRTTWRSFTELLKSFFCEELKGEKAGSRDALLWNTSDKSMRANTPYIFNLCNRNCSFPRKHIVKNRYLLRKRR